MMDVARPPGLTEDGRLRLTVVILTYNEALHLARAIASVRPFADQVIVVDSFSTDETVAIARDLGAEVLQHPFVNQARQFNWALAHAPIVGDWVFRLDADEIVEPDLAQAIVATLPGLPADVVGINLDRKHIFLGRWIRHGGRYPVRLLRIWRRGHGTVEDRWMDEHVVIEGGRAITLAGGFADHNLHDLGYFTAKHNGYATREAVQVLLAEDAAAMAQAPVAGPGMTARSASGQAHAKRWIKEHLYNRMPFWASSLGYFLMRYIVQLGFLDGREGLIYHALQGGWYRFLVGAKAHEFRLALAGLADPAARRATLARVSGLPLDPVEGTANGDIPRPARSRSAASG